jgi:hypothetical protein
VAVTFEIEGGSRATFHDNATPVKLNDGRTIPASDLKVHDVFLIRRGMWAEITSDPVVS